MHDYSIQCIMKCLFHEEANCLEEKMNEIERVTGEWT